jgi:transketolase
MEAQQKLRALGKEVSVVSMPCTTLFDQQDQAWKDSVLPPKVRRLAIEAGHADFWRKYVGLEGDVVGINRFGESAPAPLVYNYLGVTADRLVSLV